MTMDTIYNSYLLLASLDATTAQIYENPKIFNNALQIAIEAKALFRNIPGIGIFNSDDPLRITVGVWELGVSGFEADDFLYKNFGIVSKLAGSHSITFAINLGTTRDDILRLVSGLKCLSESESQTPIPRRNDVGIFMGGCGGGMRLSPREAFFVRKKKVGFKESTGEVSGELVCPYPPGIPLLLPGEVITEEVLSYLVEVKNNGGF